ncbi:MAG: acetyl-CoA carboxylase, biotin carboxyl carrier protein [Lachnospiraceae bacterium]|nr:acetyl-CoA carboxylase, biotin carboxyl carrier protein [Lachnospiraceae bacterium]
MRYESIYPIWDRFEASSLTELEIDLQGMHLKLVRNVQPDSRADSSDRENEKPGGANVHKEEKEDDFTGIKAPLTGTFYMAPSPDADPYVEVGKSVKKGDVIGLIEAMKLMNELKADGDGKIVEIMAQDGHLVEYDRPLIRIDYV